MRKLLNKTMLYYALAATILLLLTAPLFFTVMKTIYVEDIEEEIIQRRSDFLAYEKDALYETDIPNWNRYSLDFNILKDTISSPMDELINETFLNPNENEDESFRVIYSKVNIGGNPYVIRVRRNTLDTDDIIETTLLLYLIVVAILILVLIAVSRIISGKLWKPFYETLEIIAQFNLEKNIAPIFQSPNTKEFQQLNESLEKLISQNLQAYQREKEFTENASHELQTPLAIFQSKLDLLLQDPSITNAQASIIQQLYDASSRLTRINKNLLLLSKIEHGKNFETDLLDINNMLNEVIPYFSEQAEQKNVIIQSDLTTKISVKGNAALTEILLNNFLLNAIRHNKIDGSIHIKTSDKTLTIANSGSSESLETENLFRRFSKNSTSAQGSGLGLAIIQRIAVINHWQVNYEFKNQLHTFIVKF